MEKTKLTLQKPSRSYETPRLVCFGRIEDLTCQGGSGPTPTPTTAPTGTATPTIFKRIRNSRNSF